MEKIKEVQINYIDYGKKDSSTILFLHGWGQNIEMMKPVGDYFKKDYRILIVDLPGFGESEEPKTVWKLDDYVECIHELLKRLEIENPILFGHSFGGKISLLYASKYPVQKLIVCGSPFKRAVEKLSLKTKILKMLKKIPGLNLLSSFAKKHIGSTDYKKASPIMREIMVEHVNLDIREEIKLIQNPTLIIWGDQDAAVPVEDAYELEKLIADAGVVIYPGCTHYAYLEALKKIVTVVRVFLES